MHHLDRISLYVALQLSGMPSANSDKVLIYDASIWNLFHKATGDVQDHGQAVYLLQQAPATCVHRDLRATITTQSIYPRLHYVQDQGKHQP